MNNYCVIFPRRRSFSFYWAISHPSFVLRSYVELSIVFLLINRRSWVFFTVLQSLFSFIFRWCSFTCALDTLFWETVLFIISLKALTSKSNRSTEFTTYWISNDHIKATVVPENDNTLRHILVSPQPPSPLGAVSN